MVLTQKSTMVISVLKYSFSEYLNENTFPTLPNLNTPKYNFQIASSGSTHS